MFVTSSVFDGNLPGIDAADAVCQDAANAAALDGVFTAWLSNGFWNALDRVTHDGPWYLVDETLVFADRDQLGGVASTPIHLDEYGDDVGIDLVWTGTRADGTSSNAHCEAWTDDTTDGIGFFHPVSGLVGSTDDPARWTQLNTVSCVNEFRLYCFQTANM